MIRVFWTALADSGGFSLVLYGGASFLHDTWVPGWVFLTWFCCFPSRRMMFQSEFDFKNRKIWENPRKSSKIIENHGKPTKLCEIHYFCTQTSFLWTQRVELELLDTLFRFRLRKNSPDSWVSEAGLSRLKILTRNSKKWEPFRIYSAHTKMITKSNMKKKFLYGVDRTWQPQWIFSKGKMSCRVCFSDGKSAQISFPQW